MLRTVQVGGATATNGPNKRAATHLKYPTRRPERLLRQQVQNVAALRSRAEPTCLPRRSAGARPRLRCAHGPSTRPRRGSFVIGLYLPLKTSRLK